MFHCAVEGPDSVILWMHFYILSDTQPPTDEITSTLKPRVGKIDNVELEIKNAIQKYHCCLETDGNVTKVHSSTV